MGGLITFWLAADKTLKEVIAVDEKTKTIASSEPKKVLSRGIVTVTDRYVTEARASLPEAARAYAYMTSLYADGLLRQLEPKDQLVAAQLLLKALYPQFDTEAGVAALAAEYVISPQPPQAAVKPEVSALVETYTKRMALDRHDQAWDGTIPTGSGKWVADAQQTPATPKAGDWKRWVISGAPVLPAPPVAGSEALAQEIDDVKIAVAKADESAINMLHGWLGNDALKTPAGVWQKTLYEQVAKELSDDDVEADKQYANLQKNLAITIADAAMESWRVAYVYWTARPSMLDASISPALDNPAYPAYPSALSTISSAAAQVLAVQVPAHKGEWFELAERLRDAQVQAGIQLPADNKAGYDLGELVGQQIVSQQKLSALLQ